MATAMALGLPPLLPAGRSWHQRMTHLLNTPRMATPRLVAEGLWAEAASPLRPFPLQKAPRSVASDTILAHSMHGASDVWTPGPL